MGLCDNTAGGQLVTPQPQAGSTKPSDLKLLYEEKILRSDASGSLSPEGLPSCSCQLT